MTIRTAGNFYRALVLTIAMMLAFPWAAFADNIANNLDTSVDADYETLALTVGTAGYATLRVVEQNGDGKEGCNLTGKTSLKISVTSSDESKATASLVTATSDTAKDTFTSCGDTIRVKVSPVASGSSTITISQESNTTGGSFNLLPATFIANVSAPAPSNTSPTVTVGGVEHGATYEFGFVPTATCNVSDAEDTNESATPSVSAISGERATSGLGTQTVTCSYTDGGGLTETDEATYEIVDTTAPVISRMPANMTVEATSASGAVASWTAPTANDAVDGARTVSCSPASGSTFALGTTTVTCSASDVNGNTQSPAPSFTVTVQDTTAPQISVSLSPTTADGNNGWYRQDVTVTLNATDAVGVISREYSLNGGTTWQPYTGPFSVNSDGNHTVDARATDAATNVGRANQASFKLDKTAPAITPASIVDETWRKSSLSQAFEASDATSGLAVAGDANFTLTVSLESTKNADGSFTPTADTKTVYDSAGNSTTRSLSALIDLTKPTVNAAITPANPASTGWYNSSTGAPTVNYSCSDSLSGLAAACPASHLFDEGSNQSHSSGLVYDRAGNSSSASVSGVNVDTVAPTNIAFVGGPVAGQSYYYGDTPAAPTCTADGGTSGLKSCEVTGYSTAVGNHTLTATATDYAGNVSTATRSYSVLGWTLKGFYAPVDMSTATTTVYNTVKNGSTVPLKFEVFKGETEL
ncbi:MAG: HYR domain-containing protein, partial [Chloroflexota bacterium]|nr:HYR domain-containing protein [Chloroflexota bacterium]